MMLPTIISELNFFHIDCGVCKSLFCYGNIITEVLKRKKQNHKLGDS